MKKCVSPNMREAYKLCSEKPDIMDIFSMPEETVRAYEVHVRIYIALIIPKILLSLVKPQNLKPYKSPFQF